MFEILEHLPYKMFTFSGLFPFYVKPRPVIMWRWSLLEMNKPGMISVLTG